MLALPMGLHLGGVSSYGAVSWGSPYTPFPPIIPTFGPTSGALQVSVFEGLAFLGPWGERGIQTALGAGLKASGYGHSTLPGCSPACLEWGVQRPESATC